MSKNNQLDVLVAAAEARRENFPIIEPKSSTWGIFLQDDTPAPANGIGLFLWFDSKTAMLNFMEEVLPYLDCPSDGNPLAVASEVQKILFAERAGSLGLEKARKKLNLTLRSYSQIEWMGTFKELMDGKGTYAKKVIKDFRRSSDTSVGTLPITVARPQMKDFKKFLADYGI